MHRLLGARGWAPASSTQRPRQLVKSRPAGGKAAVVGRVRLCRPAGRPNASLRAASRLLSQSLTYARCICSSIRIVELPDLDGHLVEAVQEACVDSHLAKILPQGLPVRSASASRAVVDADHSVTPDVSCRFPSDGDLVRREIGDPPRELSTKRAVAVRDPRGLARNFDLHLAAVAAAMNAHAGH